MLTLPGKEQNQVRDASTTNEIFNIISEFVILRDCYRRKQKPKFDFRNQQMLLQNYSKSEIRSRKQVEITKKKTLIIKATIKNKINI